MSSDDRRRPRRRARQALSPLRTALRPAARALAAARAGPRPRGAGARRRLVRDRARRDGRDHRPQRRRQVDAAAMLAGTLAPTAGTCAVRRPRSRRCSSSAPASIPSSRAARTSYLNATVLGMSRAEIDERFDAHRGLRRDRRLHRCAREDLLDAACTCGSRSPSPPASSPTCCWSTKRSPSATSVSR